MGDLSGDVGNAGGRRGTCNATPRGEKVMKIFNRHSLTPVNMQCISSWPVDTYEGHVNGSTLDYIAVPVELFNFVSESFVHGWAALNTSDHVPVSVTLALGGLSRNSTLGETKGHIKWKKLSAFDKYSRYQCVLEPLLADIEVDFNSSRKSAGDIDRAFSKIIKAIHSVAETLPHSKYKKN